MKLAALSFAFVFSSISLAAQSAAPAKSGTFFSSPPLNSGCPVSMSLRQRLGNRIEMVQNGKRVQAPATRLTLTLMQVLSFGVSRPAPPGATHVAVNERPAARSESFRIASATAIIYGLGSRPHAELVSPGRNVRGDGQAGPARTVKLTFNSRDGGSVADLWLPSFGAVRWLDLSSITYGDGSTWRPARGESCTVRPDPFMLIGADSAAGAPKP